MKNFSISQLSEFLDASGVQWCVYDLSRRVTPIDKHTFKAIENGQMPFPTPRQGKAWLALLFWQSEPNGNQISTPYIWFAQLPLDERGAFQHANLQHFMSLVFEALSQPQKKPKAHAKQHEKRLNQNPYIFEPDEARRAALHAQVTAAYNFTPAKGLSQTIDFFTQTETQDWRVLNIQSLHDLAVRCLMNPHPKQDIIITNILQNYFDYPAPLQQALAAALEQVPLPDRLQKGFLNQFENITGFNAYQLLTRIVSARAHAPNFTQHLQIILQSQWPDWPQQAQQDYLILIAARAWDALLNHDVFFIYMHCVAQLGQPIFASLFKELVRVHTLRPFCLSLLTATTDQRISDELKTQTQILKQSLATL